MSSAEDITIAKMVLAGWRLEPVSQASTPTIGCRLVGPDGLIYGYRSTRYTAAMLAERIMGSFADGTRPKPTGGSNTCVRS